MDNPEGLNREDIPRLIPEMFHRIVVPSPPAV